MGRVKSKNNKLTELKLISILRRHKVIGWRRHLTLPGNPDFAFPRERVVVFVDGCFWHGCPLHARMPASNCVYWENKISGNMIRDRRTTRDLQKAGWRVIRLWEHELKKEFTVARKIERALSAS